jgi:hypothetical protein
MLHHPDEQFDHAVLDLIENSPTGAVPHTPTYQDALRRLSASFQVYPSADHPGAYVTARSLAGRPSFFPENLDVLSKGDADTIESNTAVFERYVRSLPPALQPKAQALLATVAGKPAKHRAKHGLVASHDPVHALFLVPGSGVHPGLPGNYLFGFLAEKGTEGAGTDWSLHLHDREDGDATWHSSDLQEAITHLQELTSSAPFHMRELEAFGFVVG